MAFECKFCPNTGEPLIRSGHVICRSCGRDNGVIEEETPVVEETTEEVVEETTEEEVVEETPVVEETTEETVTEEFDSANPDGTDPADEEETVTEEPTEEPVTEDTVDYGAEEID